MGDHDILIKRDVNLQKQLDEVKENINHNTSKHDKELNELRNHIGNRAEIEVKHYNELKEFDKGCQKWSINIEDILRDLGDWIKRYLFATTMSPPLMKDKLDKLLEKLDGKKERKIKDLTHREIEFVFGEDSGDYTNSPEFRDTKDYRDGYEDGYKIASLEFVEDLKDLIYNETVSSSGKLFISKDLTLEIIEKWEEKLK